MRHAREARRTKVEQLILTAREDARVALKSTNSLTGHGILDPLEKALMATGLRPGDAADTYLQFYVDEVRKKGVDVDALLSAINSAQC